jgi:copper transport protein
VRTWILSSVAACVTVAGVGLSVNHAEAGVHFQLVKSEPADESVVGEAPDAIRLWFSQEPQMQAARIRLMYEGNQRVELGKVVQGADEKTMIMAPVAGRLEAGAYMIAWRAMAQDGHVVTGELTFTVNAAR